MTYPGNPSLPVDVQQRIRSTFEHTLGLAEKGSRQEALLGCDFVLRMDPLFEPARRLHERLDAAAGPLAVDDLRRMEAPPPLISPAAGGRLPEVPESLWADLEGLAIDLPSFPADPAASAASASAPPSPASYSPQAPAGVGGLRAEFEALLAERRFQELQLRAGKDAAAVTGDLELQRMVTLAQERLEAGPYVSKFLFSAREAARAGNTAEARRLLDKARTLDPTHPGIAELEAATGGAPSRGPAAAGASIAAGAVSTVAPAATLRREPEMQTQPLTGLPRPAPGAVTGSSGVAVAAAPATAAPSSSPPPQAAEPQRPSLTVTSPPAADTESERRIRQLLDEGQSALDGGDPQAAIDAWSRIFLIDIDHQEAARRIETARRMKAERDRQAEETFHDGLSRLQARDAAGARDAFQRVLELQPGHLQSREYLQQLDDGHLPAVAPGSLGGVGGIGGAGAADAPGGRQAIGSSPQPVPLASPQQPAQPPGMPPLPADVGGAAATSSLLLEHDLQEEILVPPDLGEAATRSPEVRRETRAAGAAGRQGRARRLFLGVGSAVLLLVLAVGWFLYQKREQWFPNSRTEERAQPPAPNPIPKATKLYASGRTVMAIAQLSRVQRGDPHYKEVQALLAKWQSEQAQGGAPPAPAAPGAPAAAAGAGPTVPASGGAAAGLAGGAAAAGPAGLGAAAPAGGVGVAGATPGGEAERRRALVEEARKAYQGGSYLLAAERYQAADRIAKLDPDDRTQLTAAKQRLVPLQRQVAMFLTHEWENALPELWRLHESDPGNKDVTRMIVDSYYNLGVRDLQHSDVGKAAEKFAEARKLAPDDPGVKRQLLFAQTYQQRGPDLLYRIYVKYLPLR
jgi:tetratricopeptide (TPR) repeat protein